MTVVLDTVVLVRSIINPAGACGRVVLERRQRYRPVVSPSIISEYREVLRRPTIVRKYNTPSADIFQSVLDLIDSGLVVEPAAIPVVCRDPSDAKFLAAAIAGSAEFIISEDRDLLDLISYEEVRIVSAQAFLRTLDTIL